MNVSHPASRVPQSFSIYISVYLCLCLYGIDVSLYIYMYTGLLREVGLPGQLEHGASGDDQQLVPPCQHEAQGPVPVTLDGGGEHQPTYVQP